MLRMAVITLEATIENGHIIPDEPDKLPASGRVRVTLDAPIPAPKPDVEAIKRLLGRVKMPDGVEYERQIRAEWDERESR